MALGLIVHAFLGSLAAHAVEKPAVLFVGGVHTRYVAQPLVEMGIEVDKGSVGDLSNKLDSGKYNVVVVGKLPAEAREQVEQFVAGGGGALLTYPQSPHRNTDQWTGTQQWHRDLGAKPLLVVLEETSEDKKVVDKMRQTLAWSNRVSGPVSKGVKGVLTLSGKQSHGMGWPISYEFNDSWQIVVRGSKTMKARPARRTDRPYYEPWVAEQTIESSPPLMGLRTYQRGRLAIVGVSRKWLFSSPSNCPTCENMLTAGAGEFDSNWLTLFGNAFRWLAEPSMKEGVGGLRTPTEIIDPPPRVWKPKPFRDTSSELSLADEPQTNGLIGARTELSTGNGTVEDYVAAAKQAGLDFIVFLEQFPQIDQQNWSQLLRECERLSDDDFAAIPGLTYGDAQGNHLFVFADQVDLPKSQWLTNDGKRLATTKSYRTRNYFNYINEFLGQKVISGFWRHEDNFLHQADYKLYNGFVIKSFIDGRPVDDAVDAYQYWMRNGGAQAALAFEIMTSPDMVARRSREGWQVVSTRTPEKLRTQWYNGAWSFSGDGDQYITSGPKILAWRRSTNMMMHGQWYRPDLNQYAIALKVRAEAGLKTVMLYDGQRILRRWTPEGKTFEQRLTIANQQQRGLYLIVEDKEGGKAIGEEFYVRNLVSNQFYCSDRCNFLGSARLRRTDGSGKWVENGLRANAGITPNKSQLETTYRPAIELNRTNPTLPIDGKPKGLPGPRLHFGFHHHVPGEHSRLFSYPLNYLISPDMSAGQAYFRLAYDPEARDKTETPLGYPYEKKQPAKGNAWSSWHKLLPTNVLSGWTRVYTTTPLLCDHTFRVSWHETKAVFKKTVELPPEQVDAGGSPVIRTMTAGGEWRLYRQGKQVAGPEMSEETRPVVEGRFDRGIYAIRETPNGDAMVIGYGNRLGYQYKSGGRLNIHYHPASQRIEKGTTLRPMVPFVGAAASESAEDLQEFAHQFGVAEPGKVGYEANLTRGKELDNYLLWRLEADSGAILAETQKAALGAYLTTVVSGLNGNWSVHLLDRQMPWPNHRALPSRDGKAYAQLDLTGRNRDLFIGHPVVASNDQARLAVYWHSVGRWAIEVHNPTGESMALKLQTNNGWDRFSFEKALSLPPGSSQTFQVKSAHEESPRMLPTTQDKILEHRGWSR